MQLKKVVAKFKNSSIMKGKTCNFFPDKTDFALVLLNGEIVNIDVEKLKALYIVKDFKGDKNRKDNYNDIVAGGGLRIKVRFSDGELVTGFSLCYSSNSHGFFMTPADLQCNNERIFIIKSATEKVEFLEKYTIKKEELIKKGI